MLAQILGAVRPSLPTVESLGPLARASSSNTPAPDAVVHETLETCTVHQSPDGTSITRCEERRRILQHGVEVEFSTSTSTRPAAAAPAGAANNPADAHRGALGRASPSAPLALDPRSSQMLDELFATATELERSLTARGVLLDTRWRSEASANAPDTAPSSSGGSGAGAAGQEAAQPGLLRRWWGRAAFSQGGPPKQEQQQQQQQQRRQQLSLGALAAAHSADAQAVL